MNITILVADERRLIAEMITGALQLVEDFDVVRTVSGREQIVPAVRMLMPAVVVLGTTTEGLDEIGLANEIRAAAPGCAVAVIAAEPTRAMVVRAMTAGISSVVPNSAGLGHLEHAIRGASAGCPTIDPMLFRQPVYAAGRSLSDREREVLRLTATGAPIRDIAAELFLSPGTVRNLTSSAIKKLEGRNRFDAARIATKRGWL
jgi:two-component system response regulator DesR